MAIGSVLTEKGKKQQMTTSNNPNDFFQHIIEELDQAEERDLKLLGIVRCKDCRNRKTPDCPMYEIIRQEDGWTETVHYRKIDHAKDEDFCSKGAAYG